MDMIDVSSSNIAQIGYDADTSTLVIAFKDGSAYEYYDVPEHEFHGLAGAGSHGKYANTNIYKNYRQQKIR
jgi:hypothetical protein